MKDHKRLLAASAFLCVFPFSMPTSAAAESAILYNTSDPYDDVDAGELMSYMPVMNVDIHDSYAATAADLVGDAVPFDIGAMIYGLYEPAVLPAWATMKLSSDDLLDAFRRAEAIAEFEEANGGINAGDLEVVIRSREHAGSPIDTQLAKDGNFIAGDYPDDGILPAPHVIGATVHAPEIRQLC